jgi:opacity protein-like surface antigen
MSVKIIAASAFLLAAAASHVTAQDASSLYVTGALGVSIPDSWESDLNVPTTFVITGDFDASPLVRFGIGHDYDGPLRVEVELSHRSLAFQNSFVALTGGVLDVNAGSTANVTALMVNGLYDFDLPGSDYVVYAGAGLGTAAVVVDLVRGPSNPTFVLSQGDYNALAAQLRLGVERGLANSMTLFADYTYFHVSQQEYTGANGANGSIQRPHSFDPIQSHELAVGVRYNF